MNKNPFMISKQDSYPAKLRIETDPCTNCLLLILTMESVTLRFAINTQSVDFKANPGLFLSDALERAYDDLIAYTVLRL